MDAIDLVEMFREGAGSEEPEGGVRTSGGHHPLLWRMQKLGTPCLSIGAIQNGAVACVEGFGFRRNDSVGAVSGDTIYQVASISKVIFALAVMCLVKRQRLALDVDVNSYLTSWRIPDRNGWLPRVTLRQLLSHTAGTTVDGFSGYPPSGPRPELRQILDGLSPASNQPIIVDGLPGAQTRYSGGGFAIAQQVVVDILGLPFPQIMHELVLGPLQSTSQHI